MIVSSQHSKRSAGGRSDRGMRKRAFAPALTLGLAWLAAFAAMVPPAVGDGESSRRGPTWLAPQSLSGLDGTSVRHAKVAMGSDGSAVAVWERDSDGSRVIEAATREAGGGWSEPQRLSLEWPYGYDATYPDVAVGADGEMIAVWSSGADGHAVQASSRPPGGAWSDPAILVENDPWPANSPQVAIAENGDAVAIWYGGGRTYDQAHVVAGAIRPAGAAWGGRQIIAAKDAEANPRLALAPDGTATAIWAALCDPDGAPWDEPCMIRVATRRPGQSRWDLPMTVAENAGYSSPDIAVDRRGQATAAWQRTEAGGRRALQARTRPDYSSSWGPTVDLSVEDQDPPGPASACPRGQEPAVAAGPGGDTTAVWSCQTASSRFVQARTRPARASAWGETADLSALAPSGGHPNPYGLEPQVAVDAHGNSVAIWRLCDPLGVCTIQAAERPADGTWTAPRDLSSPGQDLGSPPDLGSDGRGNVAAVWSGPEVVQGHAGAALAVDDEDGAAVWSGPDPAVDQGQPPQVVQAAGYDGAGPLLRDLSVPETGIVGTPVEVSVSPLDVWSPVAWVAWDFNPGIGFGPTASHTYRRAGTYGIVVSAVDALGNVMTSDKREITIRRAP